MIKLTDRLQVLADQIEKNETMADIGTDHGFLPISLWERGICPHVILTDVSQGSLDKARQCGQRLYPGIVFDLRLGDGLQVLKQEEVDDVVIAGMGGVLMTQILENDMEKTYSFKKLILQPRTGQGKLRYWLIHHGFSIGKESLAKEGKYICEILTISPATSKQDAISWEIEGCGPDSIQYEVPPWILSAGELAEDFIQNKLMVQQRILEGLSKKSISDKEKETKTKESILYLTSLLGGS